ncbi:hypothetical protein GJ698_22250 [Pseudoduganella sp. FT26W]|uniref:Uncharacterized protein n=1 Tax=Duganella aquatilis TaxID=2666082 RepID=A0A844DDS1_9BURK|nr:phage regulatory CII family protein [Duganella aquatilis]MRW86796.1 hypothetical protein [Duganella aquatilis]
MSVSDALHKTVHSATGGHTALAARLGMSPVILRNKANPNSTSNKPTLDEVDRIIGLTGDASVLHALAANHGYVCVSVEGPETASEAAILETVTKVWMCNGDVGAEVHKALADGVIELSEIESIKKVVYSMVQAAHQMVARLEVMADRTVRGGMHG